MNTLSPFWSRASVILVVAGLLFFILAPQFAVAQEPTAEATAILVTATDVQDVAPIATLEAAPVQIIDTGSSVVVIPAAETPAIVYVALGVAVIAMILLFMFQRQVMDRLAAMTTPETAKDLFQSGMSFAGELALNNLARQTTTEFDDKVIAKILGSKGYKVTQLEDGSYHIEPPTLITPAPAAQDPVAVVNITNNAAPAPEGSASTGGSDAFHPEG